jgi:putative transposase
LLEAGHRSHRRIEFDQEFLMLTLPSTPKGTARVIPSKGVQIRNIYYWSQAFADPAIEKMSVPIRYDPFDIGVAYVFIEGQWTQCISEHYAKLHGRSEREIKILTAELRRQATAHATQLDSRLKSRAAFLHEVATTEASLTQRLKDLENQAVRSLGAQPSAIPDAPAARRLRPEDLISYEEY